MIAQTFEWAVDEDSGTDGWRPLRRPEFRPGFGHLVAHDLIEHRPDDDGSVRAELIALGAVLWIRWETGLWHEINPHQPDGGKALGYDLADLFRTLYTGDSPPLPGLDQPPVPLDHLDRMIRDGVEWGFGLAKREEFAYAGLNEADEADWDEFMQGMPGLFRVWLRRGVQIARRRYPDPYRTADAFRRVVSLVDCSEVRPFRQEGSRLRVAYGGRTGDVVLRVRDCDGHRLRLD